jgi:hypothetical protein
MFQFIVNLIQDWGAQRDKDAQDEAARLASVTTFSGSSIPGKRIRILGTVTAEGPWSPDGARKSIKLQAHGLGANYIVNYREESMGDVGGIKCFGDAVLAED